MDVISKAGPFMPAIDRARLASREPELSRRQGIRFDVI
jgi:hypothetical protein